MYIQVPISSRFTLRNMVKRSADVKFIKSRLIGVSNNLAYDLLQNVYKTTYACNVETQTDAILEIEDETIEYATIE